MCVSAGAGYIVKSRLPEHHRSRDSITLVQLGVSLLATFTAIVLGLLTTSVKSAYDAAYAARGTEAAAFAQLDQCLRAYGPETASIREQLQSEVGAIIARAWPDEPPPSNVRYPNTSHMAQMGESSALGAILQQAHRDLVALSPTDRADEMILNDCNQQFSGLLRSRWAVIQGERPSISTPFYWVLVFWLIILFATLGLCAPPDALAIIVIALTAISITGAVYVILDLDLPYHGLFNVPSTAMRNALDDMTR